MRKLALLGTACIFGALIFGCSADKQEAAKPEPAANEPSLTVTTTETPAVSFAAWTASDTRGNQHQASEWLGKRPVVINFWGTWCPPCRREIPDLVKLYKEYNSKGVEIVGFAVRDQATNVQVFANEAGMDWVMLMGSDELYDIYGPISGVPTTIFLNAQGKEIARFVGARSYEEFKPAFDEILKGYESSNATM